ncbi:MAG: CbiX/SirB N-terminal domain-containing protein [Azonexus sp.]|nr:CbiX/SirB N-terminal domain-containing protein [Azonexus sp.]MCK6411066.1 CbiX/SirB N-terminal domain-containing protein [Azonexus sp.]
MTTAVILFAHGARDPEWARPLRRVQSALSCAQPAVRYELCFLEFMQPTLSQAAADCIAAGATRIVVIPLFIAQGGHLKRELPEMLEKLRSTWPQAEFCLTGPVGEHDLVVQAMAAAVQAMAGI